MPRRSASLVESRLVGGRKGEKGKEEENREKREGKEKEKGREREREKKMKDLVFRVLKLKFIVFSIFRKKLRFRSF